MIQPQELRLGNLFVERNTKQIIEVIELTKSSVIFSENFDKEWQAEPIPLTEEWLIKLGFHEVLGVYAIYGKEINIKLNNGYWDAYFKGKYVCVIKHVHQIQNLYFALTGQELKYS